MDDKVMLFSKDICDYLERSMIPMGICYVENGRFQTYIISDDHKLYFAMFHVKLSFILIQKMFHVEHLVSMSLSPTIGCGLCLVNLSNLFNRRRRGFTSGSRILFWSRCFLIDLDQRTAVIRTDQRKVI